MTLSADYFYGERAIYEAEARLLRDRVKALEACLHADETELWTALNAIKKEIESRSWIVEGRGPYQYDDDGYRQEISWAFAAISKIIAEAKAPASKRFRELMKGKSFVPEAEARVLLGRVKVLEDARKAVQQSFHEIEQTLGKALGYPPLYPGASPVDDGQVCVGDHVPETLATEAAVRIAALEACLHAERPLHPPQDAGRIEALIEALIDNNPYDRTIKAALLAAYRQQVAQAAELADELREMRNSRR